MTYCIRLSNYEWPVIVPIDLPPGRWFLVRFERTPDVLVARTNVGDFVVGDIDKAGQLYLRHEAERIPE